MHLDMKNKINNLIDSKILIDESLKRHTTFGVGGIAAIFVYPENKKDLVKLLKYTSKNNIKIFFMGSGSNLLVSDNGFDGVIISLKKSFKDFKINDSLEATIGTGVMLGSMVRLLTKKSVKGLESLVGVPGTLGGAIIMNAGAYGSEISNYLTSITALDLNGNEKIYKKEDIDFSYRFSSISREEIIIETKFKFEKGNMNDIIQNRSQASKKRRSSQPLQFRSAGSVFKNPKSDMAAGYLIDQSNLKGMRIGDAEISSKHANFIINHGKASSNDVLGLIKIIKNKVRKIFNIDLELEVKLLGFSQKDLEGLA